MKHLVILSLFICIFKPLFSQDATTVYNNNVNSTVTIETDKGIGSGFFVAPNIIATNYHVIKDATSAYCYLNNSSKKYKIDGYVAVDKSVDLILLKVLTLNKPSIKIATTSASPGQKVYVLGSPLGLPATISDGIVSGMRDFDGYKLIQMTAPISHGSSGGPVLNANGELIGVSVSQLVEGQNLNFAIPKSYLEILLDFKKDEPIPISSNGPAIAYNDFIVTEQMKIADNINKVANMFEEGDQTEINQQLDELVKQIDKSISSVRLMPDWNGNTAFRDAAVDLFLFYRKIAQNEYKELAKLVTKSDYSEESIQKMNDLITKITEDEKPLDYKFLSEQEKFASINNFTVTPQDLVKSDQSVIPEADLLIDQDVLTLMNAFMKHMMNSEVAEMKMMINPDFMDKHKLQNKEYFFNTYFPEGFLVQSYDPATLLVTVYIWGPDNAWIHKLIFKLIQKEGVYFLEPSKFENNYLDPWHQVESDVNIK